MKNALLCIIFGSATINPAVTYAQNEVSVTTRLTNSRWQTNFVLTGKPNEVLLNNPTEKCFNVTVLIVYPSGNSVNKTYRVEAYGQTLIQEVYMRIQILNERAC